MVLPRARSTAAWCDRLLDAVLVFVATWTLVYHLCVVLRWGTTVAVVMEVAALAIAGLLAHRHRGRVAPVEEDGSPDSPPAPRAWPAWVRGCAVLTLVSALVAATATALKAPWWLVWVPWLVAAGCGTAWALARVGRRPDRAPDRPGESRWTTIGVLVWAVGLAVLAAWTQRPNPDDLFYVNYSQWVAAHGEFPIRDTLFSNLAYPMANWPPIASYDGLVGVLARLTGAHAASVEYMAVPPVATLLSVLALWRLLRTWRVPHLFWVLSTALVFLLYDGTKSYASPGNLFVTRLWQGKIILLCLLVPILLVHALRYVERPTRARLVPLALGGVAAVGLTTTGIFVTPLVALAGAAPLVLRDRRRSLAGFAAMAVYPLAAGVVTYALGGRSADDFGVRRLYRFDAAWIGHQILLTDLVGVVVVLALLLGALLVPHPAARVTTGLLVLFTGVVFVPGAMRLSYDLTGLGPTLWRISWAATVAALVGVLAVVGGGFVVRRIPWQRVSRRASPLAALVVAGLLVAFGSPIWASATSTTFHTPFHWQRSHATRDVAAQILERSRPGTLVLAPNSLSITIAVTTTDVKTVAPRDYYMHYLRHDPSFHYPQRLALVHWINGDLPPVMPHLARDLRIVGVDVACASSLDTPRYDVLRAVGFRPFVTSASYRCLHRN